MLFAAALVKERGHEEAVEFGHGIHHRIVALHGQWSFLIAVIFSYFQVAPMHQHRVLYLGHRRRARSCGAS